MPATCVRRCSSFYRNPAWGFENQADFINAAVEIETSLAPDELLKSIKEIEIQLGRKPTFRWGPRVVDIDILLYGREMIREPHLSVPHLHLLERPFAAVPLLEIAPDILLPDSRLLRNAADTDSRNLEKIGLKE
jgi:2-amino-4-hydroxy-6-hydroxymethyldihydropteridine diphosphokinase